MRNFSIFYSILFIWHVDYICSASLVHFFSNSLYFKFSKKKYLYGLTYSLSQDSSALRKLKPDAIILPSQPYLINLSLFHWQFKVWLPNLGHPTYSNHLHHCLRSVSSEKGLTDYTWLAAAGLFPFHMGILQAKWNQIRYSHQSTHWRKCSKTYQVRALWVRLQCISSSTQYYRCIKRSVNHHGQRLWCAHPWPRWADWDPNEPLWTANELSQSCDADWLCQFELVWMHDEAAKSPIDNWRKDIPVVEEKGEKQFLLEQTNVLKTSSWQNPQHPRP